MRGAFGVDCVSDLMLHFFWIDVFHLSWNMAPLFCTGYGALFFFYGVRFTRGTFYLLHGYGFVFPWLRNKTPLTHPSRGPKMARVSGRPFNRAVKMPKM
jgi:hypothetical protein